MEDNSGRPSNDMLIHETQETMDLEQKSKCSKKTKIILIIRHIYLMDIYIILFH